MATIDEMLESGRRHLAHGRFHEAELLVRQVLATDANQAEAWYLLGTIASAARRDDEAVGLLRRAIALAPRNPRYRNELGTLLEEHDDLDAAAQQFREALTLNPGYAIAHCNLGEIHKAKGNVHEAIQCYRAALGHQPNFPACQSNLLMTLNYDPQIDAAALLAEHLRWGPSQGEPALQPRVYDNPRHPQRPLRIGYVSSDFHKHAVMRFFEPILAHHDRRQFEVILYGEVPRDDDVTARLRGLAVAYHRTVRRSAVELAAHVRTTGIDILVDLTGHTGHNRLDLFALRPAPVQVTYLGYCHTTGLPAIDYRIVDPVIEPLEAATQGTEQLVRLPGTFCCFQPPAAAPEVTPPPVLSNGRITFGSHHGLPKLNDQVLGLWRQILEAIPRSRLLFMRHTFTPAVTDALRSRLHRNGIPQDRVEIRCTSRDEQHYLGTYADIDLALDSFPFCGHTTNCEALWMGVPVITLCGDRPSARSSASVLEALGYPEWIARSPEAYIDLAVQWAQDPRRLSAVRSELRGRIAERLCEGASFTRGLEAAYRAMWQAWLAQHPAGRSVTLADAFQAARRHFDAQRYGEAELLLRQILTDDPYQADARHLLGLVAWTAGKTGDAVTLLREAVQLQPDRLEMRDALSRAEALSAKFGGPQRPT